MPVPTIIVYTENPATETDTHIIRAFTDLGYIPLVDSVHNNNYQHFQSNFQQNYRLYMYSPTKIYEFTKEDLAAEMMFTPDFSISFREHEDDELNAEQWFCLRCYLDYYITKQSHERNLDFTKVETAKNILTHPIKQATDAINHIDPPTPEQNVCYGFRSKYLEDIDVKLYEVTKPHTDLPYTSITRNFSKLGDLPFFSSLFICESWGVCNSDVEFLYQLWLHFNMEGEFDIDKLYRDRVEACYPKPTAVPEPEPEVYRRSIEQVTETIYKLLNGESCSSCNNRPQKKSRTIPPQILDKV
jgi:hypothetical protein